MKNPFKNKNSLKIGLPPDHQKQGGIVPKRGIVSRNSIDPLTGGAWASDVRGGVPKNRKKNTNFGQKKHNCFYGVGNDFSGLRYKLGGFHF